MKYILNADDFGRTQTVNTAIVEGFKNGCLNRTTIMVNMPYFEEAVQLSERYGFKDKVGLHLNITSGKPLTEDIKKCKNFCDSEGLFNGNIFKDRFLQFHISNRDKKALVNEINAQIEKYNQMGFKLRHVDSHGHVHTFPSLYKLVLKRLEFFDFKSVRISLNINIKGFKKVYKLFLNKKFNNFNKQFGNECIYFGAFKEMQNLHENSENIVEIMLHPNVYNDDIQIGQGMHYEDILIWKGGCKNG